MKHLTVPSGVSSVPVEKQAFCGRARKHEHYENPVRRKKKSEAARKRKFR